MDWNKQRYWEDVSVGEEIPAVRFPLSIYRLVMEAGANRDFNSIHHNSEFARQTGAPDMYANNTFLQGMWERTAREFIGLAGGIRRIQGLRMKIFNTAGDTVTTRGRVKRLWIDAGQGMAELEMWCENAKGVSVGPGMVTVTFPRRGARN